MKQYHIITRDGGGEFNFFTEAKTNKQALKNLLKNSFDFKKIVNDKRDLIIQIKCITK